MAKAQGGEIIVHRESSEVASATKAGRPLRLGLVHFGFGEGGCIGKNSKRLGRNRRARFDKSLQVGRQNPDGVRCRVKRSQAFFLDQLINERIAES